MNSFTLNELYRAALEIIKYQESGYLFVGDLNGDPASLKWRKFGYGYTTAFAPVSKAQAEVLRRVVMELASSDEKEKP